MADIKEMAKDIAEATRLASKKSFEEIRAFVKENHRYCSATDYDKAHEKPIYELEAEYLIGLGYRKSEEVAREIFEEIDVILNHYKKYNPYNDLLKVIIEKYAELKKKYTEEGKNDLSEMR